MQLLGLVQGCDEEMSLTDTSLVATYFVCSGDIRKTSFLSQRHPFGRQNQLLFVPLARLQRHLQLSPSGSLLCIEHKPQLGHLPVKYAAL